MALAARQSLEEVQRWTDEDLATVLQELEDRARAMEESHRG